MISLCQENLCTGCWGCYDVCPKDAISMLPRSPMGDLHPVIDQKKCIECHLCEKVCPILNPPDSGQPQQSFASWANNSQIHIKSASGGIGSVLAKHFLNQGGVVYGCTSDGVEIKHIRIADLEEYVRIQGSKYVQSSIDKIYCLIKQDLMADRRVLFIGTPCQVAALRKYLKKDYERLLTVDLICHGVPSQHLFESHIRRIAGNKPVTTVKFRSEDGFCLNVLNGSQSIYKNYVWKDRYTDVYFTAFLKSYTFRESCYTCPYAKSERVSDITIGDFWGLDKDIIKKYDIKDGISVILPITTKGNAIIEELNSEISLVARPVEEAVAGNSQLRHPSRKSFGCKMFRFFMSKGLSLKQSLYLSDSLLIPAYKLYDRIKR